MMRLLLCLAVTVTLSQAARLPREVHPHFPHFHAVHHGHGATSYQNVQLESYGSVPIPVESHVHDHQHHHEVEHQHHHELEHQHHHEVEQQHHHEVEQQQLHEVEQQHLHEVLQHLHEVDQQHLHEVEHQHVEVHAHEEPSYAHHKDQAEVSPVEIVPLAENHQHHQPFIIIAKDPHGVPVSVDHETGQHYITIEVPYTPDEQQHNELHEHSQLQYYNDDGQHDHEYEYH